MKTVKPVKQHDQTDCAVACIAAIARYYGLVLPIATLRQVCGAGMEGTTIKGIMDGCQTVNLDARPLKSPAKDLEAVGAEQLPAIMHVTNAEGDPHFVVLCAVNDATVSIMDPAEGKIVKKTRDEFTATWSGYLVLVSPGEGFHPGDSTLSTGTRLRRLFSLYGREIITSTILSILYIMLGISFSLFLQYYIDKVIPNGDASRIAGPAIVMALISVLALIIGIQRTNTLLSAATGIDSKLISTYIRHLFRLPVAFFTQRGAGEINSRIGDAYTVRRFVTEGVPSIVISIITLLTAFVLMFTFHWKLALLTALFVPVYTLIFYLASKAGSRFNREIITDSTAFQRKCVEAITAVRSIKYACRESEAARAIEAQYISLCGKMFGGGRAQSRYSLLAEATSKFLTIMLLSAGSLVILKGGLSVGTLVGFYAITSFFSAPLAQLVGVSSLITQTKISSQRLFEVMDLAEEPTDGCDPPAGGGDLCFEDITFSYPGAPTLLDHFNARFPEGEITVVKGASGCGKSSLAALAMRLYTPSKGSITLGGIDISLFSLEKWRKKITIVPQEVRLFDDTILYNITCERRGQDLERVARLLVDLGLEPLLQELPRGLATMVGESGCRLSGGQKQRIAIAAALYRGSDILILDEATNSLDAASQQKMLEVIKKINRERGTTVIMITHKADEIPIAGHKIEM
ncbi:MAG: peptidase domain-containing ABC transporter [Bacteroidales bacterium]|nr:peptidase domain-containing ABC transporter [Bacteroidales bacterium]